MRRDAFARPLRARESGQVSTEYMGVIIVTAVVIAVVMGSGISENLAAYLRPTVCSITEGSCASRPVAWPGSDSSSGASGDGSQPGSAEDAAADPSEPDEPCVRSSEQKSEEESFNFLVVGAAAREASPNRAARATGASVGPSGGRRPRRGPADD